MNNIKLILLDVDGTLTDGKIYYDNRGNEMKSFNVKDGMVIAQAISKGIEFGIITGRKSEIVEKRAKELGVKYLYQGVNRKIEILKFLMEKLELTYDEVMYIGDDINDLEVMNNILWSACPKDAVEEIKECSKFVSKYRGGDGAVREIVEYVLKKQDKWDIIINNYVGINQ